MRACGENNKTNKCKAKQFLNRPYRFLIPIHRDCEVCHNLIHSFKQLLLKLCNIAQIIKKDMKEYGLIGFPLSHSFSQKYFTDKFLKEGIKDTVFFNFPLRKIDELPALFSSHPLLKGLAITIPHKKNIIPYLYKSDETVSIIGACNCVKITDDKLFGYNTDAIGFEKSVIKKLLPHHTKALILGTGGASAAVEFVLQKLNITYSFVSRNKEGSKNIFWYDDLNKELMDEYSVVINCTPLGTYPDVANTPAIPFELLTPMHYVFDLVYNPPLTKLLSLAKEKGCITENGYDMLVYQAEENWRIWNAEFN